MVALTLQAAQRGHIQAPEARHNDGAAPFAGAGQDRADKGVRVLNAPQVHNPDASPYPNPAHVPFALMAARENAAMHEMAGHAVPAKTWRNRADDMIAAESKAEDVARSLGRKSNANPAVRKMLTDMQGRLLAYLIEHGATRNRDLIAHGIADPHGNLMRRMVNAGLIERRCVFETWRYEYVAIVQVETLQTEHGIERRNIAETRRAEIIRWIAENPGKRCGQIAAGVGGVASGVSCDLKRMVAAGRLIVVGNVSGRNMYEVVA